MDAKKVSETQTLQWNITVTVCSNELPKIGRALRWALLGSLVQGSPESLPCILEQESLSSAYY